MTRSSDGSSFSEAGGSLSAEGSSNKLVDGILVLNDSEHFDADDFSARWQLPLCSQAELGKDGVYLLVDGADLFLQQGGRKPPGPVRVDFVSGASAHRRKYGGGKSQGVAKAVGVSSQYKPSVLDATAGLGRDGFVLATLGCKVDMIERHPIVYELLNSGLLRGQSEPEVADIIGRMSVEPGDAIHRLATWLEGDLAQELLGHEQPDVVYLDPMFPHSKSSAAVKKEMMLFRSLVGPDLDEAKLFQQAFDVARCRVVVKRPKGAPHLADQHPSYALAGKANRFDIYTKRALGKVDEVADVEE